MSEIITPIENIIAVRKEKLEKLKQLSINTYPTQYKYDSQIIDVKNRFSAINTGEEAVAEFVVNAASATSPAPVKAAAPKQPVRAKK